MPSTVFMFIMAALAVVAGVIALVRIRAARYRDRTGIDDDMVRQIEHEGWVDFEDDPLDLDEIDREERAFWEEERWDQSEEW
jgi:hypothetical protein